MRTKYSLTVKSFRHDLVITEGRERERSSGLLTLMVCTKDYIYGVWPNGKNIYNIKNGGRRRKEKKRRDAFSDRGIKRK